MISLNPQPIDVLLEIMDTMTDDEVEDVISFAEKLQTQRTLEPPESHRHSAS